jgi:hypothetical protein
MYEGSCLCGSVKYRVDETIAEIECCHCLTCRKAHASAFSMGVTIARDNLCLISGTDTLKEIESSAGKFRVFCGNCGSHLYAYRTAAPSTLRLRPACLDTDLSGFSIKHIYCENRLSL